MDNMAKQVGEVIISVNGAAAEHLSSSSLISDGILDSLDIMNLIMALENEFDVEIDPEDVLSENFESVEAIIGLIEKSRN